MMEKTKVNFFRIHEKLSERDLMQYALGGLMYTPAHNPKAADFLINKKYSNLHAMTFCLEDAIADGTEEAALCQLKKTFHQLGEAVRNDTVSIQSLPYIFVRVKYPEQMHRVYELAEIPELLKGFIFPKFDIENAEEYLNELSALDLAADNTIYGMPILESPAVADVRYRVQQLSELKSMTDDMKNNILNIRIGGNDFCNTFGIRRSITDTIYDIKVLADIIGDIVNVFSRDYVVSAPVWEYFGKAESNSSAWSDGLRKEIEKDILNGLIGKTAIHPTQLPIIDEALTVSADDYNDALDILNWQDDLLSVAKGNAGNRMNEQKVHTNWAKKIVIRSAIYGIRSENIEGRS